MDNSFFDRLESLRQEEACGLVVLIDPENFAALDYHWLLEKEGKIMAIFVGGSSANAEQTKQCLFWLRSHVKCPLVIFPGDYQQVQQPADALLFLSLVSGRNPQFLVGQQIMAAPRLKKMSMEVIPTAYLLIDCGKMSTVQYVSQTMPIPHDKNDLAAHTALAAQYMGMKVCYLDGGSGAPKTIAPEMVKTVREHVQMPIIVGGGIQNSEQAEALARAGANLIVVGNALEAQPECFDAMTSWLRVDRRKIK